MAAARAPVTRQVLGGAEWAEPRGDEPGQPLAPAVAELPVLDAAGRPLPFGELFRTRRAVVVFVRHFLCYICKEYVEDLAKIPESFLKEANITLIVIGQSSYHHIESFCKLTGYSYEIYVDPEREIYRRLGMKRGEEIAASGHSPHIKSNILSGSIQSLWRAVTGPLFDFQGDPAQQGGTLILGPACGSSACGLHKQTCSYPCMTEQTVPFTCPGHDLKILECGGLCSVCFIDAKEFEKTISKLNCMLKGSHYQK